MKSSFLYAYSLVACLCTSLCTIAQQTVAYYGQTFKIDTLYPASGTTGMNTPWEMVYGPDSIGYVKREPVGEVVQVSQGNATQSHQILIRPGARLDQLEEVAVLLYHPPPRPAPEQTLPNVDKAKK